MAQISFLFMHTYLVNIISYKAEFETIVNGQK